MKVWNRSLFFALAAFSANSFAEEQKTGVALMTGAKELNLGIQYRFDFTHHDHGFTKTDANKPTKTANIDAQALKLLLKGKATDKVSFSFKYDAAKPGKGKEGLEYANASWQVAPMFSLLVGKDRVNQAGFENKEPAVFTLVNSPYIEYAGKTGMPFSKEAAMVAAQYMCGDVATVTLQLVDDVVKSGNRAQYNSANKQPAMVLEYTGKFGMVQPLLQATSYDMGYGKAYTLGVKGDMGDMKAYLDYTMDNMTVDVSGSKKTTTISNLTLQGDYIHAKMVKVSLKYAMYNVKDAGTDKKGNKVYDATVSNWESTALQDNGQLINLTFWHVAEGKAMQPYFGVVQQSGKFYKADGVSTETKSAMQLRLGIAGDF